MESDRRHRQQVALVTASALVAIALAACGNAGESEEDVARASVALTKVCEFDAGAPIVEGVDVSADQGVVEWATARDAGVAFTIAKATQGTAENDSKFATIWANAKDAGVIRGAYCFFDPTKDGAAQAAHFLAAMGPLDAEDLSPALDVECPDGDSECLGFAGGTGDADGGVILAGVLDWMNAVEAATGRKPMLYTFIDYFLGLGAPTTGLDAYPLWIADLNDPNGGCIDAPSPWTKAAVWQYSQSGVVAGISAEVDRDRIVEPIDALLGWPAIGHVSRADVDGDGKSDECARGVAGVTCALSSGSAFGAELDGPAWSDANGWRDASYASTVQLGDVDGDGRADVCARSPSGFTCALSTGHGFGAPFAGPAWSDAAGWAVPARYATIQLADIDGDGKMDACARGGAGIACARSSGTGFAPEIVGPAWSDAAGWNAPSRYTTIRFADIDGDGKDDVCGRSSDGLHCALSTGAGFGPDIAGPAWSDAAGWRLAAYASTLRMADVDGDGRSDVCARGASGIVCALSTGAGFAPPFAGPAWSDAAGWSAVDRYATIAFTDVDGDGKDDVCGRASDGVHCALATGAGFGAEFAGPVWSDVAGWSQPRYALTIAPADVNGDGKGDLCARGANGVTCALSTGTGFGAPFSGPAWSDAAGWGVAPYWGTTRAVGAPKRASSARDGGASILDASAPMDDGGATVSFAASAQASGGCSCDLAGPRRSSGAWGAACALGLFLARRRRGRSHGCSSKN